MLQQEAPKSAPETTPPLRLLFGQGPAPEGYIRVSGQTVFEPQAAFGWVKGYGPRDVLRNLDNPLRAGMVLGRHPGRFRVRLPAGTYRCTLVLGDGKGVLRKTQLFLPNHGTLKPLETARDTFATVCFGITIDQDPLEIGFDSPEQFWVLNSLVVEPSDRVIPLSISRKDPVESLWDIPAETDAGPRAMFARWRTDTADFPAPSATQRSAADYLRAIEGCVDYFRTLQDDTGAIIDPYKGVEFQYATPCFAYCAVLLAARHGRTDLIEPALAAFAHAAQALGNRTAADGHEDFYSAPLAHAIRLFDGLVPAERLAEVVAPLSAFDPYRIYRKRPGGTKRSGANWNCKALAGHHMLTVLGVQKDTGYVAESLLRQGQWFNNEFGLYAEGPMTYDIFPRAWLADMLTWGYDGPGVEELQEALERGALSSLFMQSPTGELPTGGRSSHHLWSDALQCTVFEIAAEQAARGGDTALAGVFKRAARRALMAIEPWQRSDGAYHIVKNRADPAVLHGYEVYSSHSQYNLLAMNALGFAYESAVACDDIPEAWTPAERGRFLLDIGSGIDKFFATVGGTQIEVATVPTPLQTPRGLIRIHILDQPPQIPMTDGLPVKPMFLLPGGDPAFGALAMGPAWPIAPDTPQIERGLRDLKNNRINSLAGYDAKSATTRLAHQEETDQGLRLVLRHTLTGSDTPPMIEETYDLESGSVRITWRWPEWDGPMSLRWPLFAGDGATKSQITASGQTARVLWADAEIQFDLLGTSGIRLAAEPHPFRNGIFQMAEAEATGDTLELRVALSSKKTH